MKHALILAALMAAAVVYGCSSNKNGNPKDTVEEDLAPPDTNCTRDDMWAVKPDTAYDDGVGLDAGVDVADTAGEEDLTPPDTNCTRDDMWAVKPDTVRDAGIGLDTGVDVTDTAVPGDSGLPDDGAVTGLDDGMGPDTGVDVADTAVPDDGGNGGTDTWTPFFLKLEAEDAHIHGAVVATDQPGYSGSGFVDYKNPTGDYIEWTADIPKTDKYDIAFAYALSTGNRPLEIRVNGKVVSAALPFPSTGSFTKWSMTAPLTVTLDAGTNKIRATAIGSSGANVDYMTITSSKPAPPPSTTCKKFGMYEVVLKGNPVSAPDDVGLVVNFTTPSGRQRVVSGFYDGNNVWKARMYCDELGVWTWKSSAPNNPSLDDSGSFKVVTSSLRGKLRRHSKRGNYLMTDNGQTFININDTAYYLFGKDSTKWQAYVAQAVEHGISSFRVVLFVPDDWSMVFLNNDKNRFNYTQTKTASARLKWMLDNYPDVYVQLNMLPSPPGYKQDDQVWHKLSRAQQERILNNIVARFAAFPNIFWLIQNDIDYVSHPYNTALANQVGNYLKTHDIFNNLRSTGGIRYQQFQFTKASWPTYIHIETQDTTPETEMGRYASTGWPVFDGEDRYESHHAPDNPRVFFRRHMWDWILSGGSASYGGAWAHIRPYDTATFTTAEYPSSGLPAGTYKLKGLDDIVYISKFFEDNHIDLADFTPDDGRVSGPAYPRQCQVMVSADNKHYIIYHPNANGINKAASIKRATATLAIKNLPAGQYHYQWMNAATGATKKGTFNHPGGKRTFTAPWPNIDVVLFLHP